MAGYRRGPHRPRLAPLMLLAMLAGVSTCLANKDKHDNFLGWPAVENGATQNYVSNYELGTLFNIWYGDARYQGKQPCFQAPPGSDWDHRATVVDVSVPREAMRAFFAHCSLAISPAQEGSSGNLDMYPEAFQKIPNDHQQQCYCSSDYWAYNANCNACLQLHGYPSNGDGWIPSAYVSQQSSAYCTAKPTLIFGVHVT
jgi:hypothetical protein